jgi:hypothetical protein
LDDLIDTLLGNIKPSPVSFNFKNSFYEYIALKLPEWQDYFEQDKLKWDHCLNEKEGIFAAATCRSAGYGISSKQRLKYLRQWASNGSLTAAEYLIDANSDSTSSDTNPAYAVLTDPQKNFIQCLSTNHSSDLSRYVLGNTLVIPGKAKCDYLLIKNWKETHLPLQIIFKKSLQRLFIMGCAIADLETNLFSPEFIHVHIQNCPNLSKLPTAIVSYTLSGLGNHFEFNLPDNTCTQAPVQITVDQLNSRSIKPLFDGRHSGYKFVAATSQNNDDKFLAIVNQCLTAGKNFRYFMAACVSAGFEDRLLN